MDARSRSVFITNLHECISDDIRFIWVVLSLSSYRGHEDCGNMSQMVSRSI